MSNSTRSPSSRGRLDAATSFSDQLKFALDNYSTPARLGAESPLAQPYFLGQALHSLSTVPTPTERGRVLCAELEGATSALWEGPLPTDQIHCLQAALQAKEERGLCDRYYYLLLDLTYFHRYFAAPRNQSEIYDAILHVSRATYDRHLREAIQRLGKMLLLRLQPTLRLEQPLLGTNLIGREQLYEGCLTALQAHKAIYLCGTSGIGKTTLGMALAEHWPTPAVFWFTVRLTLNDQLTSLLFALGNFLHQQGAARLWLQLIANGGSCKDANLALELARADLADLPVLPLLCFDEIDLLRPLNNETEPTQHTQLLAFLEGLHTHAPLLFMGQRAVLTSDILHTLPRLTIAETAEWLTSAGLPFTPLLLTQLDAHTDGNPRLLALALVLYRTMATQMTTVTLSDVLDQLPRTPALAPIWQRLQQRLGKTERALLQALSVFRSPAPRDAWSASALAEQAPPSATALDGLIQRLIDHHLIQTNSQDGITLLPALREVIYQQLSVEQREERHRQAAHIRAVRGEYTAAAYHFQRADEPAAAIAIWQPYADQEIQRGQAAAALTVFQQISCHRLPEATAHELRLLRSQLYQLCGQSDHALEELEPLKLASDTLGVEAALVAGDALRTRGETDAALVRYGEGIAAAARLIQQNTWLHAKRGTVYIQRRELHNARREALMARYRLENLEGAIQESTGNYSAARHHYLGALQAAEMLADQSGMALVQRNLGVLAAHQADAEMAVHYHEQALTFYEQTGDRVRTEEVRSNLAGVYVQFKEFTAALRPAQQALAFFEARQNSYWIAQNTSNLATIYFELGDFTKAQAYAERTLEQEEPQSYPYALFTLGQVHHAQQHWAESAAYFAHVRQIAQQTEDNFLLGQLNDILQQAQNAQEIRTVGLADSA
ncbi:MAG: tetratricopeptide repeat protein [Caldilineaceae bacterium]|nr:tetratricopeptide repeat protein [Caldilineaceae bacterium]